MEGHADVGERNPFALSLERVLAVKGWVVGNGIDPKRIYPESKGAFESFGENHVVNRRVVIEFSGRLGRIPVSDCDPIWKKSFLALPLNDAIQVARTELRDGLISATKPVEVAIAARRVDLLTAYLPSMDFSNLPKVRRRKLLETAIATGNPEIIALITQGGLTVQGIDAPGLPLAHLLCSLGVD